jgi:hypothetical protein
VVLTAATLRHEVIPNSRNGPRVNRRRYNATKTLEAFSSRLREQVDLDALSAELLAVVDKTMESTMASL